MSYDNFWNMVRREIDRFIRTNVAEPRIGIVEQVDTGKITGRFCARVKILPEGVLSGWLPIQSSWVGGGWGTLFVPTPGAQVYVAFLENDRRVGTITGFHYDNKNPPPQGAKSGELWMVHKSGSSFKMFADGNVSISSAGRTDIVGDKVYIN